MPLILLKICLVLGAKMNNKNRKGMIIVDKIGIALLVIIVIVIVLLFLFQSDLLASFRNLPGPGGDEDKEFDGVVDEDKKGSCPFSVASIKGDKIRFDSEEFGSDENVLYLKGDVAEATIYVLQESFNIDQLNYDDAVGRISGEKVVIDSGILKGEGELYKEVKDDLPGYEFLLNLNGARYVGLSSKGSNILCRDGRLSVEDYRKEFSVREIVLSGEKFYYDLDEFIQNRKSRRIVLYSDEGLTQESGSVIVPSLMFGERKNMIRELSGDASFIALDVSLELAPELNPINLIINYEGVSTKVFIPIGESDIKFNSNSGQIDIGDIETELRSMTGGQTYEIMDIDDSVIETIKGELSSEAYSILNVLEGVSLFFEEENKPIFDNLPQPGTEEVEVTLIESDIFENTVFEGDPQYGQGIPGLIGKINSLLEGKAILHLDLKNEIDASDSELGIDVGSRNFNRVSYTKENGRIYLRLDASRTGTFSSWILKDYWDSYQSFGRVPEWAILNGE